MKIAIQAVTQAGTTTRPSAAMPRPAISEAATTWLPGCERREQVERQGEPQQGADDDVADHQPLRHLAARAADMGDRLGPGELHRAEIDDARRRRTTAAASAAATSPHRLATIISAATMLAAAKKGASWAREISCASRKRRAFVVALADWSTPSDSPSGRRAEIMRL